MDSVQVAVDEAGKEIFAPVQNKNGDFYTWGSNGVNNKTSDTTPKLRITDAGARQTIGTPEIDAITWATDIESLS